MRGLDYLRYFGVIMSKENFSNIEYMSNGFWVIGRSYNAKEDYHLIYGMALADSMEIKFLA